MSYNLKRLTESAIMLAIRIIVDSPSDKCLSNTAITCKGRSRPFPTRTLSGSLHCSADSCWSRLPPDRRCRHIAPWTWGPSRLV